MSESKYKTNMRIGQGPGGRPEIIIEGVHFENLILSDSLHIEWLGGPPNQPQVTFTLAAGAVDLELDHDFLVDLLRVSKDDEGKTA